MRLRRRLLFISRSHLLVIALPLPLTRGPQCVTVRVPVAKYLSSFQPKHNLAKAHTVSCGRLLIGRHRRRQRATGGVARPTSGKPPGGMSSCSMRCSHGPLPESHCPHPVYGNKRPVKNPPREETPKHLGYSFFVASPRILCSVPSLPCLPARHTIHRTFFYKMRRSLRRETTSRNIYCTLKVVRKPLLRWRR